MRKYQEKKVVIIGAGPAGLTAAYELCKAGVASVVLEKDRVVGGLSRTVEHNGYRFDIGGHRFFTKVRAVERIWREVLSERDFLRRPRLSRIYYDKKLFNYPLRAFKTLRQLGLANSILILLSYIHAQLRPEKDEKTYEQWVSNRFGKRLYEMFFKTYTEKVWGMACHEITADWAAQRIRGLSLLSALKNSLVRASPLDKGRTIKTLIEEFDYPRQGPGMMWEAMSRLVQERGSKLTLGADVKRILWQDGAVSGVEIIVDGREELIQGSDFISSMPIRELVQKLDPAPPPPVLKAAANLHYRDFIMVALVVNRRDLFPDNWIYIHDPEVKLGRIQNFKNWSLDMVPDPDKTCLGLEYFCFEGDGLWTQTDEQLIELGKKELEAISLVNSSEVEDGVVVRVRKAYPVYDAGYKESLEVVRRFFDALGNLQLVGRNGMHKYNNQDHSMLTAMLAARNVLGAHNDLWEVNTEHEYHEEDSTGVQLEPGDFARLASTQPMVPKRVEKLT